MADIPADDLILVSAACCCFGALYTDFPGLIGCSGKNECLCCENQICCKMNTEGLPVGLKTGDGYICRLGLYCCQYGLKVPSVLCKGKGQCFCLVNQASCPPDADVPMMCAICCVALYPSFGIFKKVSEVKK